MIGRIVLSSPAKTDFAVSSAVWLEWQSYIRGIGDWMLAIDG